MLGLAEHLVGAGLGGLQRLLLLLGQGLKHGLKCKNIGHCVNSYSQLVELLTRLDRMRQELNAAKKDTSRLVVLAHSLGATLVFEALANVFKNRLTEVWPGVDVDGSSRVIRGFGDLVVLVNPAFEAERWRPIHELTSTYAGFSMSQRPVLVVVGSETDSTTATWFPFGQWVATLFESTRDAEQRRALRSFAHTPTTQYVCAPGVTGCGAKNRHTGA